MIGWEYPPHNSGGLGVACEGLTQSLSDANTSILFTLPYHHGLPVDHMQVLICEKAGGKTFATRDNKLPPFFAYSVAQPQPHLPTVNFNPRDIKKLTESEIEQRVSHYAQSILESFSQTSGNVDVIHAHDWMTYPAAELLKRKTGKPLVAHIHSTEFDRVPNGLGNQFIAHTEYEGMMAADRVIAVSEFTKQVLIDRYQVDPQKIDVVHNGIVDAPPVESKMFAPDRPVVVFMGRLTMQKGAEYFLKLARQVLHQLPNALFVVAGHGDQYTMLLLENAKQGLSSSVLFSGFVRDQQRDFLLDRADVFVMPSISEPFGLVALEAVQRETPVIISKTSGVREVLPGAISVDFWDVDAMAKHIVHLIEDPAYYEKIVDAQMQDVAQVTWKNAAEKVKEVYRKILSTTK